MRIETFEDFGKAAGRTILGAVKIQYPVYNLHLRMLTLEKDPYFPIDRAVVKFATLQPDINITYLAALIGLEESFVRWRVRNLTESQVMVLKGTDYMVTEKGEQKYLAKDPVLPERTIYGNLVVDGITLDLLDASFYQNRAWLMDRKSELIPHMPLLSAKETAIQHTLKRLEKMTPEKKAEYRLEPTSHSYEVTDFEAQSLDNVYVVYSSDNKTRECRRDIFYNTKLLNIKKLNEEAQKFYFSLFEGEFSNSQGYHPRQGDPFFYFSSDQIIDFIKARYGAKDVMPSDFDYCEKTDKRHPFPLTIKASRGLLDRVKNRKRLIIDAIRGTIPQTLLVGAMKNAEIGFFNIHVDNLVQEFTTIYSKLNKWEGRLGNDFVEKELASTPDWRKILVYLRCYEELEAIDIDKFISYHGNE